MPENSLKHDAFWFCVTFAFLAGSVLGVGVMAMREKTATEPTTYRLEIVYPQPQSRMSRVYNIDEFDPVTHKFMGDHSNPAHQPVPQILPSPVYYEEGKRSEPGKLSPEMEQRQSMVDFWKGERSQAWLDGPPGLDAPGRRK